MVRAHIRNPETHIGFHLLKGLIVSTHRNTSSYLNVKNAIRTPSALHQSFKSQSVFWVHRFLQSSRFLYLYLRCWITKSKIRGIGAFLYCWFIESTNEGLSNELEWTKGSKASNWVVFKRVQNSQHNLINPGFVHCNLFPILKRFNLKIYKHHSFPKTVLWICFS